jgi:hypothetical protein
MARASTTSDTFNAVAEPRRRQILVFLANEEHQVGEIVTALKLDQPSISKQHQLDRVKQIAESKAKDVGPDKTNDDKQD